MYVILGDNRKVNNKLHTSTYNINHIMYSRYNECMNMYYVYSPQNNIISSVIK